MPPVVLQRVNRDTSWVLTMGAVRLLLDPWLVGAEVDGVAWFHRAELAHAPVPVDALGALDAVVVSQPFADHCHLETLALLPPTLPVLAVPAACKTLRAALPGRTIVPIPPYPAAVDVPVTAANATTVDSTPVAPGGGAMAAVRVSHVPPPPWYRLDFVHGGLLFLMPDAQAPDNLLYAPHGLSRTQWPPAPPPVPAPRIDTLLCTCTRFGLPRWLGGTVNLGLDAAVALAAACQPRVVVDTHSERKRSTGLVPRVAAVTYPSEDDVQRAFPSAAVVHVRHYLPVRLDAVGGGRTATGAT
jgi:hypothetical protein